MALSELSLFMAAMRRSESGSYTGNYGITRDGTLGAYGISRDNWRLWSAQAGLSGADWRSAQAQDAVARFKMTELYRRYGDWRLVAISWWAGAQAADEARRSGGSGWETEMQRVVTNMHGAQDAGYGPKPARSDIVAALDPDAREAIRTGHLSVDVALGEEPDLSGIPGGSSRYTPVSSSRGIPQRSPQTILATQQAANAPDGPPPFAADRLATSRMHHNMAGILQGLSNAIRRGAPQGGPSAEDSPLPEELAPDA